MPREILLVILNEFYKAINAIPQNKGRGGSIAAVSVVVPVLALAAASIIPKKRKED